MKTAIVITADISMLPGVNAILNALKYYDNSCEMHLLYWNNMEWYARLIIESEDFPFFRAFPLESMITDDPPKSCFHYLKTYRYRYVNEYLHNYDAVAIFDADMLIVNNLDFFFEVAALTNRILLPNNSRSKEQYDNFRTLEYQRACDPPLANMPVFYNPKLYGEQLSRGWMLSEEKALGDMAAFNYIILSKLLDNIFVLPNLLFLQANWYHVKLELRKIGGKNFVLFAMDDRLYSIHGRWWLQATIDKYLLDGREIGNNNIRIFAKLYKFFNTQLYYKIDWKWGEV